MVAQGPLRRIRVARDTGVQDRLVLLPAPLDQERGLPAPEAVALTVLPHGFDGPRQPLRTTGSVDREVEVRMRLARTRRVLRPREPQMLRQRSSCLLEVPVVEPHSSSTYGETLQRQSGLVRVPQIRHR